MQELESARGLAAVDRLVHLQAAPFVEQRNNLLTRWQTDAVDENMPERLASGRARRSKFGHADASDPSVPLLGQRFAAQFRERIYEFSTLRARDHFLRCPLETLAQPRPTNVALVPAVCVLGPPLSGKSTLSRSLAERLGAVRLSAAKVLEEALQRDGPLQGTLQAALATGAVPDALLVHALALRLTREDCLSRGWVLDGFPATLQQAQVLTTHGILPQAVVGLELPLEVASARAEAIRGKQELRCVGSRERERKPDSVKGSAQLLPERTLAYSVQAPLLHAFYSCVYSSFVRLDAGRSAWSLVTAAAEVADALRARAGLYGSRPRKASVEHLGLPVAERAARRSEFGHYCPVAFTAYGELRHCTDLSCAALFQEKVYYLSSLEAHAAFLASPDAFLAAAPTDGTRLATCSEQADPRLALELDGHCVVTLKSTGKLLRTRAFLVVFRKKVYACADEEKATLFLQAPVAYADVQLPAKVPPPQVPSLVYDAIKAGGTGEGLAENLTYLQVSVAEPISRALVAAGSARHLYPGLGTKSTLLHLAKHLRANNPLNTQARQKRAEKELDEFLQGCEVPAVTKQAILHRRSESSWTSIDKRRYSEAAKSFDAHFKRGPGDNPLRKVLGLDWKR